MLITTSTKNIYGGVILNNNIQYYTIKEVCHILRISPSTAARGLKAAKSKPWTSAIRAGRRVLIPQSALIQLEPYNSSYKAV